MPTNAPAERDLLSSRLVPHSLLGKHAPGAASAPAAHAPPPRARSPLRRGRLPRRVLSVAAHAHASGARAHAYAWQLPGDVATFELRNSLGAPRSQPGSNSDGHVHVLDYYEYFY